MPLRHIVLCAPIALSAGAVTAAPVTVFSNSIHTVDATFSGGGLTGTGDFLKAPVSSSSPFQPAGDTLQAGFINGEVRQPILSFVLPTIDPGDFIQSATLQFLRTFNQGQPTGFNVDIDYLGADTSEFAVSDFQASSLALAADNVFTPDDDGTPGTDPSFTGFNDLISIDVTAALLTDYVAGEFATFRFSIDGDQGSLPAFNVYNFAAHNSANTPTLILDVVPIPEPASGVLVATGLGLLLARRRRRAA
ncbi:MAG: PEP-CTERM sorting domain-containing protein [Planctomycetota bacterium]